MISFAWPWVFALLPVPFLVRWLLPARVERRAAIRVPFFARLASETGRTPAPGAVIPRRSRLHAIAAVVLWTLIVTALARPERLEPPIEKIEPARDMLLLVDLSQSMETEDFTDAEGNRSARIDAVKGVLDDFLSRREGDRVGLLFFGSAPFLQVPFTADLDLCRRLLEQAEPGIAGPQTMIGEAIGLAVTHFDASDLEDRVIILLTDGNDTGSKVPPRRAAAIAADHGIVIHAVAIGDPTTAGEAPLDEETLRGITAATGGEYFRADDRTGLEGIYRELDGLAPVEREVLTFRPRTSLHAWPLAVALGLALLVSIVREITRAVGARERRHA